MDADHEMDSSLDYQLKWRNNGDILEIALDLDQQTLGFKLNDGEFGIAFKNIKATNYRLAISVLDCIRAKFALL